MQLLSTVCVCLHSAMEKFPGKVQEVLAYLTDHPITIQSERMQYLPLSELDPGRLPDVLESLDRSEVVAELRINCDQQKVHKKRQDLTMREEHVADVVQALLYLSCGGLDEAHDLALPYSWSGYTELAGQPIENSMMAQEACYCHALVHRKEGEYIGELGMLGWSNACFWFGQTGSHKLHKQLKQSVQQCLQETSSAVRQSVLKALPDLSVGWSTDAFTALCQKANKVQDEELINFCNKVYRTEWHLLLANCYQKL